MIVQTGDLLRSSSSPESLASGDVSSPLRWCFSSPRSIARSLAGENPPDWSRRNELVRQQERRKVKCGGADEEPNR